MSKLLRLADFRPPSGRVFFERSELRKLLAVYSERVSRGEWRDYAIDQRAGMVAFAVFRSSYDWPLFVIAKIGGGSRKPGRWVVSAGPQRLIQGRNIDDVLTVFAEASQPA